MRVLLRYTAYQVPGILLVGMGLMAATHWAGLDLRLAAALLVAWVVKDVMLYPFVARSYAGVPSDLVGAERLVGSRGVVEQATGSSGWVRVGGERWRAQFAGSQAREIRAGSAIRVVSVCGLTLEVERTTGSLRDCGRVDAGHRSHAEGRPSAAVESPDAPADRDS